MIMQATGYGGTVVIQKNLDKIEEMKRIKEREISIKFMSHTSPRLRWKFKPHQHEIVVSILCISCCASSSNLQFLGCSW